jgi:hypothetical protein
MYHLRYLTILTNIRFRNVSVAYPSPVIAALVFISGVFIFVFDSIMTCENENDKAYFRPFPFRF